MTTEPLDLNALMTIEQFADWQQMPKATVRRKLETLPGVVWESREWVRIHPQTYLDARLKKRGSR